MNNADHQDRKIFLFITAAYFISDMFPPFVCEAITSELHKIEVLITSLYYKTELNNLRDKTKIFLKKISCMQKKFNCEFFDVDFRMTFCLCEHVALIVFAMYGTRIN